MGGDLKDFNILEYADPELDSIAGGDKTNIFDLDLENVEMEPKDDKQKKTKEDEHKPEEMTSSAQQQVHSVVGEPTGQVPMMQSQVPANENSGMVANNQQVVAQQQANPMPAQQPQQQQILSQQPHPQQMAAVQQQMHQHVQHQAAIGRPVPPGTQLLARDGTVGIVTSTNTVTVSYHQPFPGHGHRMPHQPHLQCELTFLYIVYFVSDFLSKFFSNNNFFTFCFLFSTTTKIARNARGWRSTSARATSRGQSNGSTTAVSKTTAALSRTCTGQ